MNKRDFYNQFRALLPDEISNTSIDMDDPEALIGYLISMMTTEAQLFYDEHENDESGICDSFSDLIISIVADKYKIEW